MGSGTPGIRRRSAFLCALMAICVTAATTAPSAFAGCPNPNPTTGAQLQTALASPDCNPITLGPGNYSGNFTVNRTVTVNGAGPGLTTVTGAGGANSNVFTLTNAPAPGVTFNGFTITGATDGSGVHATNSPLAVTNAVITANTTSGTGADGGDGGGIYWNGASPATLNVTDSAISENVANNFQGGGAYLSGTGTKTFNRVSFLGNDVNGGTSMGGGGGLASSGTTFLSNTTFVGNTANASGGAISQQGTMHLNDVTITGNTANDNSDPAGDGGGIEVEGSLTTLANTIIAGNETNGIVGGDDCSDLFMAGRLVTRLGYVLIEKNNNCTFGNSGAFIDTAAGYQTGIPAGLGALAPNGTVPLLLGSPAINTGNPAPPGSSSQACELTDQIGTVRGSALTGRCDLGATELVLPAAAAPPATASRRRCRKGFRLKKVKTKSGKKKKKCVRRKKRKR